MSETVAFGLVLTTSTSVKNTTLVHLPSYASHLEYYVCETLGMYCSDTCIPITFGLKLSCGLIKQVIMHTNDNTV